MLPEIIVKRKIVCLRKTCGMCDYLNYSSVDYYCNIFLKKIKPTSNDADGLPARLKECIKAEHGK